MRLDLATEQFVSLFVCVMGFEVSDGSELPPRMLKRANGHTPQPRHAKACRSSGKAAVSEEVHQASLEPLASMLCERIVTLPSAGCSYGQPLSEARTRLADYFNILLVAFEQRSNELGKVQHILAEMQTIAGGLLNQLREGLEFSPGRVFIMH